MMEQRVVVPSECDVVYASNPMVLDVAVKVKEHVHKPLVCQFLDVPKALFGSEDWRIQEYEKVKELAKQADHLTAISNTAAKDVEAWLGRKVDNVNYLGVDTDIFGAFKPTAENYGCAVVRGMAKQKRFEEIVKAVETCKTKPKMKLIHGSHTDIEKAKIISKCKFGLGMSTLEGFGLYVCEFGYYGKPFIGRRIPVFEEIYGNNIIYVETPEEMADKIDWLMADEEARTKAGAYLANLVQEKRLYLSEHVLRLEKTLCSMSAIS